MCDSKAEAEEAAYFDEKMREEYEAEIERLRAALREIRGWREIGRDDVLRRIEEICEEALNNG